MSQNQSYFWQTTRHNVYLKRSAKYHLVLALIAMLAYSTVCLAEIEPKLNEYNGPVQTEEATKLIPQNTENILNNEGVLTNDGDAADLQKAEGQNTKATTNSVADLGFIHAFIASISVILVSELGDKTFFIAAIMAMRHARLTVFSGAIAALGLMTVLSAVFGMAATIIPRVYTYYISTALFAIFGLKMLKEGYYMKASDNNEELEEVRSDLKRLDDKSRRKRHADYEGSDAKGKRKNANPESSNDTIGNRLASNSEMQHRQRKQLTTSSTANNLNLNNNNNESDEEDEKSSQRRAMLPPISPSSTMNESDEMKHPTGKMSSYASSPCLSTGTISSNITSNQNCDMKASGSGNLEGCGIQSSVQNVIKPGVHTTMSRFSANCGLKDLSGTNSISNNNLNIGNAAGQLNGKLSNGELTANGVELKQLGNNTRLEAQDVESGDMLKSAMGSGMYMASRIFMQAFTMTFLAEWGDRSQLTTIILSAREDVYGVIFGGILGHSICTGLAVIGGRMIAQKISVRTVTLVGGIVFLFFAVTSLFMSPNEQT